MTKIRGGRQAYELLLGDLQIIETALRDIADHSHVVRLVDSAADDGLSAVRSLRALIIDTLGPMLERRDKQGMIEIDELLRRIDEQEQRIVTLDARIAELEAERRGVVPFRKTERR